MGTVQDNVTPTKEENTVEQGNTLQDTSNTNLDNKEVDTNNNNTNTINKGNDNTNNDNTIPTDNKVEETKPVADGDKLRNLLVEAKLDVAEVGKAIRENSGKVDLDTALALKEQHGAEIAGLIINQLEHAAGALQAKQEARDQEVYAQVAEAFKDVTQQSGEETWKELAAWSKDNVSNENRAEINKLLQQGGLGAKLAVQDLVAAFKESQDAQEVQPAQLLDGDGVKNTVVGGTLTKAEYTKQLQELMNNGHDYNTSPQVAELNKRRMLSMRQGI